MQLPLTCGCGCKEWFMIELQGEIEGTDDAEGLDNLCVGMLCSAAKDENMAQLNVGYHQLEGKVVKLPKPIAVLKKRQAAAGDASSDGDAGPSTTTTQFDVIGVVRRKLHFKSRPKALISKSDPVAAKARGDKRTGGMDANFFTKKGRTAAV